MIRLDVNNEDRSMLDPQVLIDASRLLCWAVAAELAAFVIAAVAFHFAGDKT